VTAPRGFVVSAAGTYDEPGNARYVEAATRLLNRLANHGRVASLVMAEATKFYPHRLVMVVPDTAGCSTWKRNAHARPFRVGSTDIGAVITYTPKCWSFEGVYDARAVLLHEIVHAARYILGVWAQSAAISNYPNAEEFHAVTLANVYRSEQNLSLRLGYSFGDPAFIPLYNAAGSTAPATSGSAAAASGTASPQGPFTVRSGGTGNVTPFNPETEIVPRPTIAAMRAFSGHFARHHPLVATSLRARPIRPLLEDVAGLPWDDVPFNPFRAVIHGT